MTQLKHLPTTWVLNVLFAALFCLAGFSQIGLGGIKPINILSSVIVIFLVLDGCFKLSFLLIVCLFSFIYASIVGDFSDLTMLINRSLTFCLMFAMVGYFKKVKDAHIEKLIRYFTISMFASNILAIIILLSVPSLKDIVAESSSIGFRLKGFFTQSNGYSFVLIFTIPLALHCYFQRKTWFNLLMFLTSCISLVLAQSRGAIVSVGVGLLFVYLIFLLSTNQLKKLAFPLVLTIAFLSAGIFVLPKLLENSFGINLSRLSPSAENTNDRRLSDISLENIEDDRSYLANAAFTTLEKYPFGLGYQAHHIVIGRLTGVYLIPHDYYLSILLYYGVFLGTMWLCGICYLIFKGLRKLFREKIGPNNLFFHLNVIMISLAIYYFTHSPEWFYMFVIIALYCSRILTRRSVIKDKLSVK